MFKNITHAEYEKDFTMLFKKEKQNEYCFMQFSIYIEINWFSKKKFFYLSNWLLEGYNKHKHTGHFSFYQVIKYTLTPQNTFL